mmetsp:Transcript_13303/g.32578  ORF Transcript_13303/g.32578 Transcript_13303/m.32578 type:complete len:282 (+) Transcript_13303:4767-5612(+)
MSGKWTPPKPLPPASFSLGNDEPRSPPDIVILMLPPPLVDEGGNPPALCSLRSCVDMLMLCASSSKASVRSLEFELCRLLRVPMLRAATLRPRLPDGPLCPPVAVALPPSPEPSSSQAMLPFAHIEPIGAPSGRSSSIRARAHGGTQSRSFVPFVSVSLSAPPSSAAPLAGSSFSAPGASKMFGRCTLLAPAPPGAFFLCRGRWESPSRLDEPTTPSSRTKSLSSPSGARVSGARRSQFPPKFGPRRSPKSTLLLWCRISTLSCGPPARNVDPPIGEWLFV